MIKFLKTLPLLAVIILLPCRMIIIDVPVYDYFESYRELKEFVARDDTEQCTYVRNKFDCEDFAMRFQRNALKEGKITNCQWVYRNGEKHCLISVFIPKENMCYHVEPQWDLIFKVETLDENP